MDIQGIKEQMETLPLSAFATFYKASFERECLRINEGFEEEDKEIFIDLLQAGQEDILDNEEFYTEELSFFNLLSYSFGSMVKSMIPKNINQESIEKICKGCVIEIMRTKKIVQIVYHYASNSFTILQYKNGDLVTEEKEDISSVFNAESLLVLIEKLSKI